MSDRDPRVERTRRVVLAAAADLLADEGFERITIEAIAERTGVARSTIYRNWPARADLLIEAFDALCNFGEAPDTGSLGRDLRALGEEIAAGLRDARWGHALPSLIGACSHDPELLAAQRLFSLGRRRMVAGVFARARDRGEVPVDCDLETLAELFVAPFFFRRLVTHEPLDAAFVERQAALVLHNASAT